MKKQFLVEDATMALQWIVVLAMAPFALLPLFPAPIDLAWRFLTVACIVVFSAAMTAIYIHERKISVKRATMVANVTALLDVVLIFIALLLWPEWIPQLFWIFPIVVIVAATRFGYMETALLTLVLSGLFAITMARRFGGTVPAGTIIGETLIQIVFMMIIALATAYISNREKQQRQDADILSTVAAAIGSTLDFDELMQATVEGINKASGLGRCSAFLVSGDGRWATMHSTTEENPAVRRELERREIDLRKENAASRVMETREPLVITDAVRSQLLDHEWIEAFDVGAVLVLPLLIRDRFLGVIFVEGRKSKRYFLDREVEICESIISQASVGLENAGRYQEEQRKSSEALILYRSSRELASTLELDQVAENACRLAMGTIGAAGCVIFLEDERRRALVPRISVGPGDVTRKSFPEGNEIDEEQFENLFKLAQRPPTLSVVHPAESTLLPPFIRDAGSVIMVPFHSHGRLAGVLCVCDEDGKTHSEGQKHQLAAVAGETALALVNANLHERIKSDAAQLSSLVQLTNAIGTTSDLQTIMGIVLETVRHLFNADSGLIYRVDDSDGTLRHVDSFGYPAEVRERLNSPPYQPTEECWTVSEGRLIGIDDLSITRVACRTLEKIGRGSTICVGMTAEKRTLGVLHIRSERTNAFGEEDQQLALAIADQVALVLQRAILFEEINRLAITDPLTGVFNVRRLTEILADEVSRARRYERPVSFLMIDLDNLKAYNDTLGHPLGDVTLSQVASILDTSTREVDKVFRYGGDEFCVVLPETDELEAVVVAEKVRRAVSDFHFPGEERLGGGGITISIGVASFPRHCGDEEGLVREADRALYQAKQGGRNSVAAAT